MVELLTLYVYKGLYFVCVERTLLCMCGKDLTLYVWKGFNFVCMERI